ncbi:ABC transporter substrate-binding protein [Candidatus Puniceispirillum marinum]|uniref:Spermidine/putrescine ABC transporter, periplasmic substrate-binding protein n=1 Tax=Puniceispirillum marinum (strain IMCC1322) TaxID=488538 RepID=D5BMJ4_PUNMI|nr:ABC transporter substrate-binding protein [Candidatus Puniceispirillum marinum]ADE40037.1 spermidine/putrescine ABC transporter, periplasmic substrate-binding protein [Candidatus Puniceispirillum marinum IMCC1322]
MKKSFKLKSLAVTAAVASVMSVTTASFADELRIVSWGGAYQKGQSVGIFQPAAKAMGITVKEDTYGGISDVKLMVKSGADKFDIFSSGAGGCASGGTEGILEKLDYSVIDVSNHLPGMYSDYCAGADIFSVVAAWNTDTYGDNGPRSWADFFDVEKFPGTRAMRAKVDAQLEAALLADGVAMEDIYTVLDSEEGIDRALDKIRSIKDHIAVWWTSGAQHAQLMKDGEVDMTTGWNGRFDVAKLDGAKVAYDWKSGIMDWEGYGIPKNAKNKDLAMKYIAEMMKPEYMAEFAKYITYGPTNTKVYELGLMEDSRARQMPSHPDNAKHQLTLKTAWYAKWRTIAAEKYTEMMTE